MFKERFENFFEKQHEINYRPETMYQMLKNFAIRNENSIAYEFQGKKTKYLEFLDRIEVVAKGLTAIGIRENDVVTICMPNCPQAVDTFYAINRIGAVANMIHPLSAQSEITFYLNLSKSRVILTLDQFYEKVVEARRDCSHQVIILMAHISDELPFYLKPLYKIKAESKYSHLPNRSYSLDWNKFISMGENYPLPLPKNVFKIDKCSVILYSGGTTGSTKGIMLTDLNFNALSMQAVKAMDVKVAPGDSILAAMPLFHGFGLGIGIHTCLTNGAYCSLIPSFTVKTYGKTLLDKKPNFIAGVPTLFEAMLRTPGMDKADLSFLKGMYSGGDSLSIELKAKVDKFLKEHKATIQICEGYGTTECVTASCLTPKNRYKEGSIGLPFSDTTFVICPIGEINHLPPNQEGEICLSGPTVMLGYLNDEEETAKVLKIHEDGKLYLHTGDLGFIDEEGFIYFKQRIKRMIITSGYNVYPSQIENIIDGHPKVQYSCVIGVKDPYKIQRVKAFCVLKPGIIPDDSIKNEIKEYCAKHIAKYACPREFEFRDELPKTLVGKVAYRILEQEEEEKNAEYVAMRSELKTETKKSAKKTKKKGM
ncbi:MAG: class I adenylate-forming enzyme family protein [Bacillota bacterium]|jgi:long-chain acyl-CoA synthetase|nr:class I adenylate-forming enzyme family protein [Bacillota bacterium]NLL25867.1 acyl--CoA ligase [Erysipelotrichia bacterium]